MKNEKKYTPLLKRMPSEDMLAILEKTLEENGLDKAKELIPDSSNIDDKDHFDLLWGIANNRDDKGEKGQPFLLIEHLIQKGFNVGFIKETVSNGVMTERTDIIDQIAKQSGNFDHHKYGTDLAIVLTILRTGKITVFEKEPLEETIGKLERKEILISSLKDRDFLKIKQEETLNPEQSLLLNAEGEEEFTLNEIPNPTPKISSVKSTNDRCCILS